MKKSLRTITLVVFGMMMFGCKNSKDASESSNAVEEKMDYKKLAAEKFDGKPQFTLNDDKSMVLCHSNTQNPNLSGPAVSFFVYDNKTNSIIYEDKIDRGSVSWYSNTHLALFYTPGTMAEGETRDDYTFIYDLVSKEKTKKAEFKKKEEY